MEIPPSPTPTEQSEGTISIDSRVNGMDNRQSVRPRPRPPRSQSRSTSSDRRGRRGRRYDRDRRRDSRDRRRDSRDRSGRRRSSQERHRNRRSRSRSRSSRRDGRRSLPPSSSGPGVPATRPILPVSKVATDQLASWMSVGQPATSTKELRDTFNPDFEDTTFSLTCPKMDDVVERQLLRDRNGKYINQRELIWKSTQLKVLDVAKPLMSLWNRFPENSEEAVILECAIRLWAEAHFYISKNRRSNVMNSVYPRFKNLLKDPSKFSPAEVGHLFGPSFTSALLQAADEDAKLQKVAASGRGKSLKKPHLHTAKKRAEQQPSTSRHKDTGERKTYQTRYAANPVFFPISLSPDLVGARIKLFGNAWRAISKDPWILSVVERGFFIDFVSRPLQKTEPPESVMGQQMEAVCAEEVASLLRKGAIMEATETPGFFSNIFAIPKKNGGFRPIINLRNLNRHIRYEHFKMEGLDVVRNLLQKGDWLAKLDLKDAYLTVPVCHAHQPFLRFRWKGTAFQFTCLAFGLAPAPRAFTKLLKPVMAALRSKGVRVVIYLDDMLFLNQDRKGLVEDVEMAVELLLSLGFLINWDKSLIEPCHLIEYLGMVIDAQSLSFILPEEKRMKTRKLCVQALERNGIKLRDLAKVMGNFAWAIPAVPFAQSHYRKVQAELIRALRKNDGNFDGFISLSGEAKADLNWWVSNMDLTEGKVLFPGEPDLIIFSDASLSGWGASCNGVTTRGPWTPTEAACHINELELLAALFALQSFTAKASDIFVSLQMDNSTAVCYVNKGGGSRSFSLSRVAGEISAWCENRRISIQAVYLPVFGTSGKF